MRLVLERAIVSWFVKDPDQFKSSEQPVGANQRGEAEPEMCNGQLDLRDDSLSIPLRYATGVRTSPPYIPYIHAPLRNIVINS